MKTIEFNNRTVAEYLDNNKINLLDPDGKSWLTLPLDKCDDSLSTCTEPSPPPTVESISKMLAAVIPAPLPLFYVSKFIDPDDCFKTNSEDFEFYSLKIGCPVDKNVKEVYICGTNVRDALIKKGVAFQNYEPED
jgi:hypothetical protein